MIRESHNLGTNSLADPLQMVFLYNYVCIPGTGEGSCSAFGVVDARMVAGRWGTRSGGSSAAPEHAELRNIERPQLRIGLEDPIQVSFR